MQTIQSAGQFIRKELQNSYPNAEITAFIRLIFAKMKNFSAVDLYLKIETELDTKEQDLLLSVVEKLKKQEPIQYILGETEFLG